MKHVFLTALTFCFALSACTNPSPESAIEGTTAGKGIYDGEITTAENPIRHTTVLIYGHNSESAFTCTGSILNPSVILTAAHCVTEFDQASQSTKALAPGNLRIVDPTKMENMTEGYVLAEGTKVIAHPLFLAQKSGIKKAFYTVGYDLALIQLSKPLPETFKSVSLSDNLEALTSNQVYAAGFGSYSLDANLPIDFQLRYGPVTVNLSEKQVFSMLNGSDVSIPHFATNTTYSPTISFVKNSHDATFCHGDSGGPLYYVKGDVIYLAGVNVAMLGSKNGEDTNCTLEGNGYSLTVSIAGPPMSFILDSYKELTGTSLPLIRDNPSTDPNTFDFYLSAPVLNSKNSTVNLDGFAVVKDNRDNTVIILDLKTASTICENSNAIDHIPNLYIYVSPTQENYLDGKTILPVLISNNGVAEGLVETRMKLNGNKVKVVALTTEGYLSTEMPYKVCDFPPSAN